MVFLALTSNFGYDWVRIDYKSHEGLIVVVVLECFWPVVAYVYVSLRSLTFNFG